MVGEGLHRLSGDRVDAPVHPTISTCRNTALRAGLSPMISSPSCALWNLSSTKRFASANMVAISSLWSSSDVCSTPIAIWLATWLDVSPMGALHAFPRRLQRCTNSPEQDFIAEGFVQKVNRAGLQRPRAC